MKISKSNQELARIISENDGWIAGNFASQQDDGEVWFSAFKPKWKTRCGTFDADYEGHFTIGHLIANRHQTILSRDEYFSLYPVAEAAPEQVAETKPTIEQLAADYRNAKGCAERKQQEADAAKAYAEAKLAELVAAGDGIGLVLSVADSATASAKFTGNFHSAKHGDRPSDLDIICDGCVKRFGTHVGFDCRP